MVEQHEDKIRKVAEALGWNYEGHLFPTGLVYLYKKKRSGYDFPLCLSPELPIDDINNVIELLGKGTNMLGVEKNESDRKEIREYLIELRSELQKVMEG